MTFVEKDNILKKLNSLGTDPKKNWAVLNKLLNKNQKTISDSIAESSRDFSYLIENSDHCMYYSHSTPDKIAQVIFVMKKMEVCMISLEIF